MKTTKKPKIVCFCGSSKFIVEMAILMWEFEKLGCIALGLHYMPPQYGKMKGYSESYDHLVEMEDVADKMDELHKRKIDLADEIFVVNVKGYIGKSTRSEIKYAKKLGKKITYLVNPKVKKNGYKNT